MLVVGFERGAILLQPHIAFLPADRLGQSGLQHLRQVQLEPPRVLEQALVDTQIGGLLAPAGDGGGHGNSVCKLMRIVYAHHSSAASYGAFCPARISSCTSCQWSLR